MGYALLPKLLLLILGIGMDKLEPKKRSKHCLMKRGIML